MQEKERCRQTYRVWDITDRSSSNKVNQSPDNSCRTEFLVVLCCVKRQFMALFYTLALRQR